MSIFLAFLVSYSITISSIYQKSFAQYNIFYVSEQDHFAMNKNVIKSS